MTIPGQVSAEDLIRYARSRERHRDRRRQVASLLVFELLHGSIVKELIRHSGTIDIYIITGDKEENPDEPQSPPVGASSGAVNQYIGSVLTVALASVGAEILKSFLSLPNLSMVFLLAVLLSSMLWGLRASILASLLSVLVYDFFFVSPVHTFTINSPEDMLALAAFLVVAVMTSNLTGRVRDQAESARRRELRTAALYALSREMAGAAGLASGSGCDRSSDRTAPQCNRRRAAS